MARISDCIMSLTMCELEIAASTPGDTGRADTAGEARVDIAHGQDGGEPCMLRWASAPFCRVLVMAYRKKDTPCPIRETAPWNEVPVHRPVTCRARDYRAGTHIAAHKHRRHQLVYSMSGLMVVRSEVGRWVVPSTRAIWIDGPHEEDSRDGRVVRLMLDELRRMDVLPLHLPEPVDPRLHRICQHIQKHPGDE